MAWPSGNSVLAQPGTAGPTTCFSWTAGQSVRSRRRRRARPSPASRGKPRSTSTGSRTTSSAALEGASMPFASTNRRWTEDAVYENTLDPEPTSREVFSFHRLYGDARRVDRRRAPDIPKRPDPAPPPSSACHHSTLGASGRRRRGRSAISRSRSRRTVLEPSIQMATGSGKTYTAANVAYRLGPIRRRCTSGPLPRRPREPRPPDAEGVPGFHRPRFRTASSPSCTTSSTLPSNRIDDVARA